MAGILGRKRRNTLKSLVNPRQLADQIAYSYLVQTWQRPRADLAMDKHASGLRDIGLARVFYYDARPEENVDPAIENYWKAIELLHDTEIGFGTLRGRPRRQKRVDGLIAVDMMVGTFTDLFQVAILITGDSDFVPVVDEVKRRGVMVVIAAVQESLSDELRRAADRVYPIDPKDAADFPPLQHKGMTWFEDLQGKVATASA
jgi:uncharacterized LabA/DUF88 family protein